MSIDIPGILYHDINADCGRLIYTVGILFLKLYSASLTRNALKILSNDLVDLLYRCQIKFEKYIMHYVSSDMELHNKANFIHFSLCCWQN